MITWADDMAAILALVRTAVDALVVSPATVFPAGTLGCEMGWRDPSHLSPEEYPHFFIFNPRDTATELDFEQADVTSAYQAELYAIAPRASVAGYAEAIKAAVANNPKLNGTARRFRIAALSMVEDRAEGFSSILLLIDFAARRTVPS